MSREMILRRFEHVVRRGENHVKQRTRKIVVGAKGRREPKKMGELCKGEHEDFKRDGGGCHRQE